MTEAEWLSSVRAGQLLVYLQNRVSARKLRLLAIECTRVLSDYLVDPRLQRAMLFVEENVGRQFRGLRHRRNMLSEATAAMLEIEGRRESAEDEIQSAHCTVHHLAADCVRLLLDIDAWRSAYCCRQPVEGAMAWLACISHGSTAPSVYSEVGMSAMWRQAAIVSNWVRDVFGNPFRPVEFEPSWRTDTAVSLAHGIYESRGFSAMPILADALQDAGCDNVDILAHCRDESFSHVRGCWVVDGVLAN